MADNFEPFFHVPQQTRRDKLRVLFNNNDDFQPLLFPAVFNPSLNIPPSQSFNLCANTNTTFDGSKGMGFMNMTTSSSTPTTQFMYLNSTTTIQDFSDTDTPFVVNSSYGGPVVGGAAASHQSLSLSLSSSHSNTTLPLGLNSSLFSTTNGNKFGSTGGSCTSLEGSKSSVPLGPFTGYASVLNGSRFLKPAQLLLEEICDVGCKGNYGENDPTPRSLMSENEESVDFGEQSNKERSTLVLMLDEVYKRYKMYYQQIQAIVTSFESVAGLSHAAPFANLALQALSKHFQCLKNSIKDQLQCASKSHDHVDYERNETQRSKNSGNPYVHKPFRPTGYVDQPVWRPQRGLPERAVTVLRAWLFEHFLHPYPTDTDKLMLAKQAGLSRNQVSNWFINARVRIWKPMVEEIHNLETRQSQKDTQTEEPSRNTLNNHLPTSSSFEFEIPSTSIQKIDDFTLKRSREDLTTTILGRPMNLQSDNLPHQNPQSGVGVGNAGGVSLTLGLPPNGIGLSESFRMHAARRFGLDAHGEGSYMLNSFASQNQQFGRDIAG